MSETFVKETAMSGARLQVAGQVMTEAMNFLQKEKGFTVDEALMAALYAIGAALKQRGVVMRPDEPVSPQLQPLCNGYKRSGPMRPEQARPEWGVKH